MVRLTLRDGSRYEIRPLGGAASDRPLAVRFDRLYHEPMSAEEFLAEVTAFVVAVLRRAGARRTAEALATLVDLELYARVVRALRGLPA